MTSAAIVNAVLALGVIVMVIAPLVWAIRTQHRDHATETLTTVADPAGRATRATRTTPGAPGHGDARRHPKATPFHGGARKRRRDQPEPAR